MTETGGVRRNVDDPHSHLSDLSRESYQAALSEGWIQGGMKVKLDNAFSAIDRGVGSVAIAEPGAVRGVGVTTRIQVQ
jgi:acetylglutamate kinase